MATLVSSRIFREILHGQNKNCSCFKKNVLLLEYSAVISLSQTRHMSPRKNSPFQNPSNETSFNDGGQTSKKRSVPDSLYQQPVIPEQLMKYDQYKDRVVMESAGGMLSTYTPLVKKATIFSVQGLKERWQGFKDFLVSTYSIGIIKRSLKPFKVREFAKEAEQLFIDVNNCLSNEDKNGISEKTTSTAYYGFTKQFFDAKKKFYWRYKSSVDRPRIVHATVSSVETKENLFAQIIVRMNINQISVVKDKNDRVLFGDATKPRNLLEYIVLERHLGSDHGKWRICGKLFPKKTS